MLPGPKKAAKASMSCCSLVVGALDGARDVVGALDGAKDVVGALDGAKDALGISEVVGKSGLGSSLVPIVTPTVMAATTVTIMAMQRMYLHGLTTFASTGVGALSGSSSTR